MNNDRMNKFELTEYIAEIYSTDPDHPWASGSLRTEPGIFPAYHMNKESWISVALDGSVPDDKLRMLLDISFELTKPKISKRN